MVLFGNPVAAHVNGVFMTFLFVEAANRVTLSKRTNPLKVVFRSLHIKLVIFKGRRSSVFLCLCVCVCVCARVCVCLKIIFCPQLSKENAHHLCLPVGSSLLPLISSCCERITSSCDVSLQLTKRSGETAHTQRRAAVFSGQSGEKSERVAVS